MATKPSPLTVEIRAWAVDQGYTVPMQGRIPTDIRKAWESAQDDLADPSRPGPGDQRDEPYDQDDDQPEPETPPVLSVVPDGAGSDELGRSEPPLTRDERQPRDPGSDPGPPRKRGMGRIRERISERAADRAASKKRSSVARVVGSAWAMAGRVLAADPSMVPVSRVLQLQAPVAGAVVDRMVRGSVIDRMLQPLARAGDRGEAMFALLAPPILVTAITRDPEGLGPMLMPVLREAMESWIDLAGPEVERQRKRIQARREQGIDVDALLEALFEPPPQRGGDDAAAGQ